MTFFFRQMRPLIDSGRLYLAQPPLYRISNGKETFYASTEAQRNKLIDEVSNGGKKKIEIGRFKGLGEMTPPQLKETTMDRKKRILLRVMIDDGSSANEPAIKLDEVLTEQELNELNDKNIPTKTLMPEKDNSSDDSTTSDLTTSKFVEQLMGRKPEFRFRFIQEQSAILGNIYDKIDV